MTNTYQIKREKVVSTPHAPSAEAGGKNLLQEWAEMVALPGSRVRTHAKGAVLSARGGRPERVQVIMDGWVKICTETIDGKESVVDLLSAGGLLGEKGILGITEEESYSAEVISERATVLEVPVKSLVEHIRNNPKVSYCFVSRLILQVQYLRTHVEQLTSVAATERVINFLTALCEKEGTPFSLPCEKTKLAPYLGMERETLSRILSQLKRKCGLGVEGNVITIPSRAALRAQGDALRSATTSYR